MTHTLKIALEEPHASALAKAWYGLTSHRDIICQSLRLPDVCLEKVQEFETEMIDYQIKWEKALADFTDKFIVPQIPQGTMFNYQFDYGRDTVTITYEGV